jgi:D-alanine-D-alanine ligase
VKIAFTFNLQSSAVEEQAEFDTPETVESIRLGLEKLGHDVECIDVNGSVSRLTARLEQLRPDLVFNTAEGTSGRYREAFYPALFEELRIPFTGSDAYVCGVTLDKNLTKRVLADADVPMAGSVFIREVFQLGDVPLRFPVIIKPNFEGSSKGITESSVVEDSPSLYERGRRVLAEYPDGILVEEYIPGRDVVVPYIESAAPRSGGILEPASYRYTGPDRKHAIYDLDRKLDGFSGLEVVVPADIPPPNRDYSKVVSRRVIDALGIRDFARLDFRMDEHGHLFFLEINALPSLEDGSSLYLCGRLAGLDSQEAVLDAIVRSAARRHGISASS